MGQGLKSTTRNMPRENFCFTIRVVRLVFLVLFASSVALAQGSPESLRKSDQNPPVKVNILNVCAPNAGDQQELKGALARLPKSGVFGIDYEISRGVSTVEEGKSAKYIRFRRDFKNDSPLTTVQYSLSSDPENTIETLVFQGRELKDLLSLSIEDKLSTSVSKPSAVIQTDTPASRIRVERSGKTTLALARCEGMDQSQYEPIFAQASATLAEYRRLLRLRTMLAGDISWLSSGTAGGRNEASDVKK